MLSDGWKHEMIAARIEISRSILEEGEERNEREKHVSAGCALEDGTTSVRAGLSRGLSSKLAQLGIHLWLPGGS